MKKAAVAVIIILLAVVAYILFVRRADNPMVIKSSVFGNNGQIPPVFTCSGKNINPELIFENIPEGTKSLALIMDDPDASGGITFIHWLIWNIPSSTDSIPENSVPAGAVQGKNDAGIFGYTGPCPPPGKPHHYRFKLFALDETLNIPNGSSLRELEKAIGEHLVQKAEIVGIYERKQ